MPEPSESSGIVVVSSLGNDVEQITYETLIAETVRRSTWFMLHANIQAGFSQPPTARLDIATGLVGEEIDLLPDLGVSLTGGTGVTGTTATVTSFPFVIEKGVRLSCRIRSPVSGTQNFDVDIRLIK